MTKSDTKKYPAPWNLKGTGYIFLYKFKKSFVEKNGFVPDFLKNSFIGGFGSVMLVNYQKSNAGPYSELLFIPGKFKYHKKKLNTISKIYVSTNESVVNGRINWGIPKERADFKFSKIDKRKEKIEISLNGKNIMNVIIKHRRFTFLVSTKLLPFPLVEEYEGKRYFTNFFGKGKGRFAKIIDIDVNKDLFPDISIFKPFIAIQVDRFNITFPTSKIENIK